MPPNEKPPLSKGDDLADVDAELESAMSHLDETSERIDRMITDLEEEQEGDEEPSDNPEEELKREPVDEGTEP